jgi:hypothetical protein
MINPHEPAIAEPPRRMRNYTRTTEDNSISFPFCLENWAHLPEPTVAALTWLHQHIIDNAIDITEARKLLGINSGEFTFAPMIRQVILGTYKGDWKDIVHRIEEARTMHIERVGIRHAEFRETPVSKMIWAGLDYSIAAECITIIQGDSGHGKTVSTDAWIDKKADGRAVKFDVPAVGGTGLLMQTCAKAIGFNRRASLSAMREAIFGAFGPDRPLIVDEATRLLPKGGRNAYPEKLEFFRELHDITGAPINFLATYRLIDEMEQSTFIFEQVLGRSMIIRLPAVMVEATWFPIVVQYFPKPSKALLSACNEIANNKRARIKGRLRMLGELFKLAMRIASKAKQPLREEHFFKALALREQMMGKTQMAA